MGNDPSVSKSSSKERWILISIVLGTFMASLDVTIVAVALPTIEHDFTVSGPASDVSWILIGYTLSLCCFILLWGKLGTNYGYKRLFLFGVIIFAGMSLTIGVFGVLKIGGLNMIILLRMLQGLGAGMITAMGLAMVSSYLPNIRGKAVGTITLASSVGLAFGPVIGGFLCQFHWSFIFFINVPIGLLCILLSVRSMANVKEERGEKQKLDGLGVVFMVIMLFSFIYYLNTANNSGWFSDENVVILSTAFIFTGLLIWWEQKVDSPIISVRIMKIKDVVGSNAVNLLICAAFSGSYFLLPYYLETVRGYSTVDMGLILVATSIGMMVVGPTVGKISDKTGINNRMSSIGCLISAFSFVLMIRFDEYTSLLYILFTLFLMGVGIGMGLVATTNLILGYSEHNEEGSMSSIINMFRQAGSSVGVAVLGAVFTASIAASFVLNGSMVSAFKPAFFVACVLCFLAFVFSMVLKDKKVRDAESTK